MKRFGRSQVYNVIGYGTLLLNAYLILGLLATQRMPRTMHVYLPPYGSEWFARVPGEAVLAWVTATILAATVLLLTKARAKPSGSLPIVAWVWLVLGGTWLGFLLPLLVASWEFARLVMRHLLLFATFAVLITGIACTLWIIGPKRPAAELLCHHLFDLS